MFIDKNNLKILVKHFSILYLDYSIVKNMCPYR